MHFFIVEINLINSNTVVELWFKKNVFVCISILSLYSKIKIYEGISAKHYQILKFII